MKSTLFSINHHIEVVNEDSKRVRSLIVGLIFAAFLVFVAFLSSLKVPYSWFKSRIEIKKVAYAWFYFPDDAVDTQAHIFSRLDSFALYIEKQYSKDTLLDKSISNLTKDCTLPIGVRLRCKSLDSSFIDQNNRIILYNQICEAASNIRQGHILTRHELQSTIDELIKVNIEHFQLVRVPILGVSFDSNYLGFLGGGTILVLYVLLYFSLVREHRNLVSLFGREWSEESNEQRQIYEFLSMYQVLTVPKNLFTQESTLEKTFRWMVYGVFYIPGLVVLIVFSYDVYTYGIGYALSPILTIGTILFSLFFLLNIIWFLFIIRREKKQMDYLWDNQAYEFNIEFLLESTGDDKEIDIEETKESQLSKGDITNIKIILFNIFYEGYLKYSKLSQKRSILLLENFLNQFFNKKYKPTSQLKFDENVPQEFWKEFVKWFNYHGRRNIEFKFRETFAKFVNDFFSGYNFQEMKQSSAGKIDINT